MMNPNVVWIPGEFTLENVKAALTKLRFAESAILSLKNTVLGTAASLVSCALIGYGFARYEFAEKGIAWVLVLLTIIIPPQTMLITQFLQYRSFDFGGILGWFGIEGINLLNTSWVFLLPALFGCGLRNGLFIFIFRQFYLGLPKELEEAARVDGCGFIRTFIRIVFPVARSAYIVVMVLAMVWHWSNYYEPSLFLGNTEMQMLSMSLNNIKATLNLPPDQLEFLYQINDENVLNNATLMAGTLMVVLPILIAFCFLQRQFIQGVERTGLTGE